MRNSASKIRHTLLISLTLQLVGCQIASKSHDIRDLYYVYAPSLNIREQANLNAKVLETAPSGAELAVLQRTSIVSKVQGITAPWFKVQTTQGIQGYTFSGYLLPASYYGYYSSHLKQLEIIKDAYRRTSNSFLCARDVEASQQVTNHSAFLRQGKTLTLFLKDKGTKVYVDNGTAMTPGYSYSFLQYVSEPDIYVVHIQPYEGQWFEIVSAKDGRFTSIPGYPVSSPNFKRIVTTSPDVDHSLPSVQIWNISTFPFVIELRIDSPNWSPGEGLWLDDQNVVIPKCLSGPDSKICAEFVHLNYKNNNWVVQ